MGTLPYSFYNRKTLRIARELLGKFLARRIGNKIIRQKITEVEAYVGADDLASHSARGKTKRNTPMFMRGGTIYVYFTYGMHWMLNIVTEEKGTGAAVLIRGTEHISGPARLTKALKIDKSLNGKKLGKKSGLWIEYPKASEASQAKKHRILRTPRIGVAYAKDGWAEKPYRFLLKP